MHVVVAGEIGGAERMLIDLASRPDASDASHSVALMTPNAALAELLREARLRVFDRGRVHENAAAYLWRSLGPADVAWLADVIRRDESTVVHLHTFASQVLGTRAAERTSARIVRTEHSTRVYTDPTCWPFSRWSLSRVHAVVAVSEHIRRVSLSKGRHAGHSVQVVRNGVDAVHFSPRAHHRQESDRPCRFLTLGRLEPRKGTDLAIDALALSGGSATLDVVGDGEQRAVLEGRAAARGLGARVRFHGFVPDPRDLIAECDAVVCSSREEGLGIALLEAMAMARPVVAFRVGGVPEIVEHGHTGLLSAQPTCTSLADAMRQALEDRPRLAAMGHAARAFVEDACSIEAMCEGYRRVYEETLTA